MPSAAGGLKLASHVDSFRTDRPVGAGVRSTLSSLVALASLAAGVLLVPGGAQAVPSTPVETGYRDANYGINVYQRPTAEKPESKLWWNDDSWWGFFWDDTVAAYRIHEYQVSGQHWESVGPDGETRPQTLVDCLWDNDSQQLYVVSHEVDTHQPAVLRVYSYDSHDRVYALLPGYPVEVGPDGCEAMTVAKDSTGKLWVAWERGRRIWVNHSLTSDLDWGTKFEVPGQGNSVNDDDICAVAAFDGKIGVFWSNQEDNADYFAYHDDGDPDSTWAPRETALMDSTLGAVSDDHMNVAVASDGTLYTVVKTSLNGPDEPILYLLKRDVSGDWSRYSVGLRRYDFTRPIVLLDEESRLIHVFMNCIDTGDGTITWKTTSMDSIAFEPGDGKVFISSATDLSINNPTSTKQNVDSISGLLVAASDNSTDNYFHNYYIPLSAPVDVGWRDAYYGTTVQSRPTAEKPESKLWWNDGTWWAFLWDEAYGSHRIQRFDPSQEAWISEGPDGDTRTQVHVDCLWDGQFLYVASHALSGSSSSLLYSYSYDPVLGTYEPRVGFPVNIGNGGCEALTIAKDSTGKLWASWERGRKIYVNRSLTSDTDWGTPFQIPVQPGNVTDDDLCAMASFGGKVGVLWSDQSDETDYFAYHVDGDPDMTWAPLELAFQDAGLGAVADDHVNLAAASDGTLYAAVKTDLGGSSSPQVCVLRRDVAGTWTWYQVNTRGEDGTRPMMVIDESARRMYVFFNSRESGDDAIHYKESDLDNISFPAGPGDLFIASDRYRDINNPTSTKQPVNSTTGLLVEASNGATHHYLHRFLSLTPPAVVPDVAVFPATCDWGTIDVGTDMPQYVTIRNYGLADLHVSSLGLNGPDAAEFSLVPAFASFVVAPGDSVVGELHFAPATPGNKVAMLSVVSDDPDENPLVVTLQGTGYSSSTGVPNPSGAAFGLHLSPPRPNPARGREESMFQFTLPGPGRAQVSLFDVAGRRVARRDWETYSTGGAHSFRWNPGPLPSGTYFVRLTTDAGESTTTTWVRIR